MKILFLIALLTCSLCATAQSYLGDEGHCVARFDSLARIAMAAEDQANFAVYMGDSIPSCFVGEHIPASELITIQGDTVRTDERDRPYVLYFTASWCGPCVSSTQALNVVMDSLQPAIDFFVLSWDQADYFAKNANKYHDGLYLIPSKEAAPSSSSVHYDAIRHEFGFPSVYVVNAEHEIVSFQRGAAMPLELPDGRIISETEALRNNIDRWITNLATID